jgi:hypothetical protein
MSHVTKLSAFIDAELERYGLRISARLPVMERLNKMILLVCQKRGFWADEGDVAVLAGLIELAFAQVPEPLQMVKEMRSALIVTPMTAPEREEAERQVSFGHPMVRRSQVKC